MLLTERRQQQSPERAAFEAWERSSRAKDVETEMAERLRSHTGYINRAFDYELTDRGLRHEEVLLEEVLARWLKISDRERQFNPNWQIEYDRNVAEGLEYDRVKALALGEYPAGTWLLTVSAVPEQVHHGQTILGYKADSPVAFVRLWQKTTRGVRGRTVSFDGSSPMALRAGVQALVGVAAAEQFAQLSSAQAIARPIPFTPEDDRPDRVFREAYDRIFGSIIGQETFHGKVDDQGLELNQLLREPRYAHHVKEAKWRVFQLDQKRLSPEERRPQHNRIMHNNAAAIRELLQNPDLDAGDVSSEAAGAAATEAGQSFEPDCPSAPSGTQAMDIQYGRPSTRPSKERFYVKQCPNTRCGRKNFWATREGSLITGDCGCVKDICEDGFRRNGRGQQKKQATGVALQALASGLRKNAREKVSTFRRRLTLGGTVLEIMQGSGWRRATQIEARGSISPRT